jgi:hypothetical protein
MLDEEVSPSPDVERTLRAAGWAPDRVVDTSKWVEQLRKDGNEVFPLAEAILQHFGGLRFVDDRPPRPTRHDFQIDPLPWFGEGDRLEDIEAVTGARACPLGETSGAAMLAVLDDGRIIADLDGCILQLATTWREALDNLVLGRAEDVLLAEDYDKPVEPPRPWRP